MSRSRRPEHPFPFLEKGTPSPYSQSAFLNHPTPRPQRQVVPPQACGFLPTVEPALSSPSQSAGSWVQPIRKTPAIRRFSKMLRQGARVLLDLSTGQCMLYTCANGIRVLGRLTIRMLSQLLHCGDLVMAAREQDWVHYAHPGANLAWFRPEEQ